MKEFTFYLDAWKFCVDNTIPFNHIIKKDFRTWIVVEEITNGIQ